MDAGESPDVDVGEELGEDARADRFDLVRLVSIGGENREPCVREPASVELKSLERLHEGGDSDRPLLHLR